MVRHGRCGRGQARAPAQTSRGRARHRRRDASPQSPSRGRGAEADLQTIVRLANHFGVSFWVARYRAKAAGAITSPTRLRELDALLRERQWQLIPRQLFLGGVRDTLSLLASEARSAGGGGEDRLRMAPRGVRVPGSMRSQVLGLLERGEAPLEQAAAWLRIDPADLRYQLEQLGIE